MFLYFLVFLCLSPLSAVQLLPTDVVTPEAAAVAGSIAGFNQLYREGMCFKYDEVGSLESRLTKKELQVPAAERLRRLKISLDVSMLVFPIYMFLNMIYGRGN